MKTSSNKPAVNQLPPAGRIHGALALAFGAEVHGGGYNWRDGQSDYMVVLDAIERHILCLIDGEDCAPDSGVHHLGHIVANASILLDAFENGTLIDNRPTKGSAAQILEEKSK